MTSDPQRLKWDGWQTPKPLYDCNSNGVKLFSQPFFTVVFHPISSLSVRTVINYSPRSLSLSRSHAWCPCIRVTISFSLPLAQHRSAWLFWFPASFTFLFQPIFLPGNKRFHKSRLLQWRAITLSQHTVFLPTCAPLGLGKMVCVDNSEI